MPSDLNELGQPVGAALTGWVPPIWPAGEPLEGRFCRLETIQPARHAKPLFDAFALDTEGRMWTYLPYGPFATLLDYQAWLEKMAVSPDPMLFAITDKSSGQAVGLAGYLRIDPANGSIEVGHLAYSPLLQRQPAATEAMFLMMQRAFDLGYRRYEWKCHSLNHPSRAAAERLGFTFEGIFRQAVVVKGRNRDTAWFSLLDQEWPAVQAAFHRWLAPANFDPDGRQRERLAARAAVRALSPLQG